MDERPYRPWHRLVVALRQFADHAIGVESPAIELYGFNITLCKGELMRPHRLSGICPTSCEDDSHLVHVSVTIPVIFAVVYQLVGEQESLFCHLSTSLIPVAASIVIAVFAQGDRSHDVEGEVEFPITLVDEIVVHRPNVFSFAEVFLVEDFIEMRLGIARDLWRELPCRGSIRPAFSVTIAELNEDNKALLLPQEIRLIGVVVSLLWREFAHGRRAGILETLEDGGLAPLLQCGLVDEREQSLRIAHIGIAVGIDEKMEVLVAHPSCRYLPAIVQVHFQPDVGIGFVGHRLCRNHPYHDEYEQP